ncbi:shikimate kinase [Rathayibacter toxicus]|nr:shikimate kinase [Rathayibacter toxicus]
MPDAPAEGEALMGADVTGTPRARVVFIGPMGAGKTSIGKRVAAQLSADFVDSDAEFVRRYGLITPYFDLHGEAAFRREERRIIARELRRDTVLSLGGGAVLDEATRADLAAVPVVFLTTTAEAVSARVNDGTRPLVRDGVGEWVRLFEQRRVMYESLADTVVDTSRRTITRIATEIAQWVRDRQTVGRGTAVATAGSTALGADRVCTDPAVPCGCPSERQA